MERLWLSGIGDAAWRRAAKIREVFGRQLFQCDVSDQVACNRPRVLDMLVDRLLLFALAAYCFIRSSFRRLSGTYCPLNATGVGVGVPKTWSSHGNLPRLVTTGRLSLRS